MWARKSNASAKCSPKRPSPQSKYWFPVPSQRWKALPIDSLYVPHYHPYRISIGGSLEPGTDHPASGHPGLAHPQITRRRGKARARDLAQNSTDYGRDVYCETRFAVSGAPSDGGRGLDFGFLGRFGKQPPREILPLDQGGPEAAGRGNQALGPHFVGHRSSFANLVAGCLSCLSSGNFEVFLEISSSPAAWKATSTRRSALISRCSPKKTFGRACLRRKPNARRGSNWAAWTR